MQKQSFPVGGGSKKFEYSGGEGGGLGEVTFAGGGGQYLIT